jgi:hypothetical protein
MTTLKKSALGRLHYFSRGNLRLCNILMDRCLCVAFLYDTRKINRQIVNEAFRDLGTHGSGSIKRTAFLYMAVFLVLALWGGFFYNSHHPPPFSAAHNIVRQKISTRGQPVAAQLPGPQAPLNHAVIIDSSKMAGHNTGVPEPVSDFMAAYQLTEFAEEFFQAVTSDRFEEAGRSIFSKTGYQLVQLEEVPNYINEKYDILAYPQGDGGKEKFYLFWRPKLKLPAFYYSYQGEEIRKLQEILAGFRMYNDTLDGSVGKNLMKAVINFQRLAGLPVSGSPDNRTLFYLCNQAENSYQ